MIQLLTLHLNKFICLIITFNIVLTGAKEVKIDEDLEPELIKNLWDFKNALCESFITRFSHDMESDEPIINKATGKPRRIVTYNVMRNKNFILAALLDPRIKSVPFNSKIITLLNIP